MSEKFEKLTDDLKNRSCFDYVFSERLSDEVISSIVENDKDKLCEAFIDDKINIIDLFVDRDYCLKNLEYGIYLIKCCSYNDSRDVLDFLIQTMGTNNDLED